MLKQVAHSARKRVRPEVFHPLFHGINHPGLHNQLFNRHEPISTRQAYGAEDNGMVSMSDGMSALIKLMKPACTNVREIAVDQWLLRLWEGCSARNCAIRAPLHERQRVCTRKTERRRMRV